jgi:hypothetical protein
LTALRLKDRKVLIKRTGKYICLWLGWHAVDMCMAMALGQV